MADMRQVLTSMEESIKMQNYVRMQKRAEKAQQEEKEFREKLMQAAISKAETEGIKANVKGNEAAVQRDSIVAMMML